MIKLLVVDDHPIFLEGMKNLFSNIPDLHVTTLNFIEAFSAMTEEITFDVYLLDVNLGTSSSLTLAEAVKKKYPSVAVILYTSDNIEYYYPLIIEKKIDSIISKSVTKESMLRVIYAAMNGEFLLPKNFINFIHGDSLNSSVKRLNNRERKILELVKIGYTNRAIARELNLSQRTIENDLSQIYSLFNVGTRTEAVIKAKEYNLI